MKLQEFLDSIYRRCTGSREFVLSIYNGYDYDRWTYTAAQVKTLSLYCELFPDAEFMNESHLQTPRGRFYVNNEGMLEREFTIKEKLSLEDVMKLENPITQEAIGAMAAAIAALTQEPMEFKGLRLYFESPDGVQVQQGVFDEGFTPMEEEDVD